ncbi:MAG: rane protein [Hyphomicrobiales bacterium]|nr:rane protein [Hyphomicrobiales bacterium]
MTIMSDTPVGGDQTIPVSALLLGLGGLIPFFGLTAVQIFAQDDVTRERAVTALVFYAATILSFLGGIGWGLAMRERDPVQRGLSFGVSIVPALIAWAAAFINVQNLSFSLGVLGAAFLVQWVWDAHLVRSERAPRWFGALRLGLTLAVLLALTATWLWRPALEGIGGGFSL